MLEVFAAAKIYFTIAHIFGVAIGAGGAFASDSMFFFSVKDRQLSRAELAFLRIGSLMVWVGLLIIFLSGIGLFLGNVDRYLNSTKFLAKITIVLIIFINGIIFHRLHMPRFHRHADHHFPSSDEFVRHSPYIMASGAISVTSWCWAIVLGVLGGLPYSYLTILTTYLLTVLVAIGTALAVRKRLLGMHY